MLQFFFKNSQNWCITCRIVRRWYRECACNHHACVSLEFGAFSCSTNNKLRDRKTSFIFRTLSARRKLPRDFSPPAFPTKVRKLRVDDFEVVRGQASLTAEAQETRLFCSVSLNFSVSRLPSPRFPARLVHPAARFAGRSVSRLTPEAYAGIIYLVNTKHAPARHCIIIYLPTL